MSATKSTTGSSRPRRAPSARAHAIKERQERAEKERLKLEEAEARQQKPQVRPRPLRHHLHFLTAHNLLALRQPAANQLKRNKYKDK